ncbi:hypothetical protein D3C72_2174240 [compost metagenome]
MQKNKGVDELYIIRKHADEIIEAVERNMLSEIRKSSNIESSSEAINLSLQVILIDAFIRCKILEEPIKNATS